MRRALALTAAIPTLAGACLIFGSVAARYPTAVELSGLGLDKSTEALEGNSLLPVLRNPSLHLDTPAGWKQAVFMQYPRCMNSTIALEPPFLAQRDACIGHNANLVTHMVRTFCLATLGL